MQWTFAVLAKPDYETILPLADVKDELDVTFSDDDLKIVGYRNSAIDWVQDHLNRFLGFTSLRFYGDRFDGATLPLPFAPVVSVQELRVAGSVFADTRSISGEPYRLSPLSGHRWPTFTHSVGAIEVDYTVGYPPGEAPDTAKQAIRLISSIFYDKPARPQDEWDAVANLLQSLRYTGLA